MLEKQDETIDEIRGLRYDLFEQERIIFDNRTQMNADNQDFKYKV